MPHLPLPPPPRLAHVVRSLPGKALSSRSLQRPQGYVPSRRVSETIMEVSAGWALHGYTGPYRAGGGISDPAGNSVIDRPLTLSHGCPCSPDSDQPHTTHLGP